MKTFKNVRIEINEKTLTPAEKKKREEVAKAIERENPNMPMGMKMAIATKTAKRVAEEQELEEAQNTGKNGHRPGWMLRADPELAKKVKANQDLSKRRQAAYGDPSKGISVKEENSLVEAKGLSAMSVDQLEKEHEKVMSKINTQGKSKMISMNHPLSQRARLIRLHIAIKKKQANEEVQIDELKTATLKSYVNKAETDVTSKAKEAGTSPDIAKAKTAFEKAKQRQAGISKAYGKMKEDVDLEEAVNVSPDRYVRSHAKNPQGKGSWMFTHKKSGTPDYGDEKQVHKINSSYSEAKKSAAEWAKKHGHPTAYVMESSETEQENTHFCAKHVRSSLLGDGVVLEAQHAEPDEFGDIEWYLVEFKSGIHKVYTEDLEIMLAEYHGNHKKKRMTNGR